MKLFVTRHGQTNLNKRKLMQGLTDAPLNETGIEQAKEAHKKVEGIKFDAVYASPLKRAIKTAAIIANIPEEEVIIDPRIIEVDFGKYEQRKYWALGLRMTSYWACPEIFPNPNTVESIDSMVKRSGDFIEELKTKNYQNVLVVCHGGIIRAICGNLENCPKGIKWRPKPANCEIREYTI